MQISYLELEELKKYLHALSRGAAPLAPDCFRYFWKRSIYARRIKAKDCFWLGPAETNHTEPRRNPANRNSSKSGQSQ